MGCGRSLQTGILDPRNLEERPFPVGRPLYEAFVKQYTENTGHESPTCRPMSSPRLPVRFLDVVGYYNDRWQGIPDDGYGALFRKMLANPLIEIRLNTDYFEVQTSSPMICWYTPGPIDQFSPTRRLRWRPFVLKRSPESAGFSGHLGHERMRRRRALYPYPRIQTLHPERPSIIRLFSEYSMRQTRRRCLLPVRTDADTWRSALNTKLKLNSFASYSWGRLGAYAYLDMENNRTALDTFAGLKTRLSQ